MGISGKGFQRTVLKATIILIAVFASLLWISFKTDLIDSQSKALMNDYLSTLTSKNFSNNVLFKANEENVPGLRLCLGIFSQISSMDRRAMIRNEYTNMIKETAMKNDNVTLKFVVGIPSTREELDQVRLELLAYNDIEILPMPENMDEGKTTVFFQTFGENYVHYPIFDESAENNLRDKIMLDRDDFKTHYIETFELPGMLRYDEVQNYGKEYDFIAKVDDDTFVNIPYLLQNLRPLLGRKELYYGRDCCRKELLSESREFPYMCGFFYVVSPDLAFAVSHRREVLLPWEDVQMGYSVYKLNKTKNSIFEKSILTNVWQDPEHEAWSVARLRKNAIAVHNLKEPQVWLETAKWYRLTYAYRAQCNRIVSSKLRNQCNRAIFPIVDYIKLKNYEQAETTTDFLNV